MVVVVRTAVSDLLLLVLLLLPLLSPGTMTASNSTTEKGRNGHPRRQSMEVVKAAWAAAGSPIA